MIFYYIFLVILQIAVSALGLLAGEMVGVGRCRGLWLVKRRDKDLVGRLITLCCPLSHSNGASRRWPSRGNL